jgi:hypothetical protein
MGFPGDTHRIPVVLLQIRSAMKHIMMELIYRVETVQSNRGYIGWLHLDWLLLCRTARRQPLDTDERLTGVLMN